MSDLISRQAAIKAIENLQDCYNGFSDTYDKACIIGLIEEVPSAQRNGKWMFTDAAPHRVYCSNCYATLVPNKEWLVDYNISTNYCPNCGARMMRGEEE